MPDEDLNREYRRIRQWGMKARGPEIADSFGIEFSFDGGRVPLTLPLYSPTFEVPTNCRVIGCRVYVGLVDALAGVLASATFNIWRGTFQDYPSLTLLHDQAAIPTITSAPKADINVSTWTTKQVLARDTLACQIVSLAGNPTVITLVLLMRKTPSIQVSVVDNAGVLVTDNAGNPVLAGF